MPPNTRNGAFIHDPKVQPTSISMTAADLPLLQMANEKEVKAQVRLRFWNVNRQRMTATRNVQVTMKKGGGLTMKTLEGILAKTDVDGGEGKVRSNFVGAPLADVDVAEYHLDEMFRNGRGSALVARSVNVNPGERHFLPSRGVELASL